MSKLVEISKKDVIELPIELINDDAFTLRANFEGIEELAYSIKNLGLIEPIVVRRSNGEKPYELIAGHRRLKACKMIGCKTIKALIINANDKDAYLIAIAENLQRKSLNPIEEAMAYYNYIHKKGWGGITELAKNLGKSPAYISMYIKLLDLPVEIQEMIAKGEIKPFVAAELEKVKDNKQMLQLSQELITKKLSMRQLRQRIKELSEENVNSKYYLVLKNMITATRNCLIQYDLNIHKLQEGSEEFKKAVNFRFQLHQLLDSLLNELKEVKDKLYREGVNI